MKTRNIVRTALFSTATVALAIGAANASEKLTLSGYTDTTDNVTGAMLASHDYSALIERLAPHSSAFSADEVVASTNLCVAYAATHRVSEARQACQEAVSLAKSEQPGITLAEHRVHDEAVELALANEATVAKLTNY